MADNDWGHAGKNDRRGGGNDRPAAAPRARSRPDGRSLPV